MPAMSLLVSLTATRWLASRAAMGFGPMDHPNARSLHATPVPRTGGMAVLVGLMGPFLMLSALPNHAAELVWLVGSLALVAVVSFIDDLGDVPPSLRLFAHVSAALLMMAGGMTWSALDPPGMILGLTGWVSGALTVLFVVWMINLYNFMDGMDGLAGGMAIFGFSALAVLGWIGGEPGSPSRQPLSRRRRRDSLSSISPRHVSF